MACGMRFFLVFLLFADYTDDVIEVFALFPSYQGNIYSDADMLLMSLQYRQQITASIEAPKLTRLSVDGCVLDSFPFRTWERLDWSNSLVLASTDPQFTQMSFQL